MVLELDNLEEIHQLWNQVISKVSVEKFEEFLYNFMSLRHEDLKQERLYEVFCQSIKNADSVLQLLIDLEAYCNHFTALLEDTCC